MYVMKRVFVSLSFCILLGLSACGLKKNAATLTTGKGLSTEFGTPIVKDLSTVTVNKSTATLASESGNGFLQLSSLGGTSPAGSFYGGGVGNKAFIGIGADSFAGKLVSDFHTIQFSTRELATNPSGSYNVYLNMLIDLNCNPGNPSYVIAVADQTATPGAKGNWYSFVINGVDSVFKSVGGKGGLPNNNGSVYAPLTTLSNAYPLACFVATDVMNNGMKKAQKLSPFLLVHGDSAYSLASTVQVDGILITVGSQTLTFSF